MTMMAYLHYTEIEEIQEYKYNDGIPDYLDPDDDNDGIPTIIEIDAKHRLD